LRIVHHLLQRRAGRVRAHRPKRRVHRRFSALTERIGRSLSARAPASSLARDAQLREHVAQWKSTVRGLRKSCAPTSRFDRPWRRTSRPGAPAASALAEAGCSLRARAVSPLARSSLSRGSPTASHRARRRSPAPRGGARARRHGAAAGAGNAPYAIRCAHARTRGPRARARERLGEPRLGLVRSPECRRTAVGDAAARPGASRRRGEGTQLVQPSLRFQRPARAAARSGRATRAARPPGAYRLELRDRRLGPAGDEVEHAKRPPCRVVDQASSDGGP
jgi:hypothetical protein